MTLGFPWMGSTPSPQLLRRQISSDNISYNLDMKQVSLEGHCVKSTDLNCFIFQAKEFVRKFSRPRMGNQANGGPASPRKDSWRSRWVDREECRDFRSDFNRVSNINNEISFYFCYKHQSSTTLNCLKYFISFYLNNRSILNYYYVVLQFYHRICNKII